MLPQVYLFGVPSAYHICRFMSFTKFGEFQPLFLRILFQPHFFSPPSGTLTIWMLDHLLSCHRTLPLSFFFFFSQSIFSPLFRIDKFYYSVFKFTNLPSVISTLLLNPSSEFLISLTIFLLRFHLGPLYNFDFFSNILYFLLQENLQLVIKAFL